MIFEKRRLETAEEMEDLRQPAGAAANSRDAASSRLPKHDEISLQVKVRQYCENYIALGITWTGNPDCPLPRVANRPLFQRTVLYLNLPSLSFVKVRIVLYF